jgi:D-alanine-D-alanine ligase
MTPTPLHVLLLFGGESAEHPISLRSAATVLAALQQTAHRVTTVGISRDGVWIQGDFAATLKKATTAILELSADQGAPVTLGFDGQTTRLHSLRSNPEDVARAAAVPAIDVVFPMVHGPLGEDGKLQGLLELMHLPFVGAAATASALAMDKIAMKTLCAGADLPQVRFLDACDLDDEAAGDAIEASFGFPAYVKPANLGSSVGVAKVCNREELSRGLSEARRFDPRVLVEEGVDAREIEIAILGSKPMRLSPPGEIMPPEGFYDFKSKYVDATAELRAPTEVSPEALAEMHRVAERAWNLIGGAGLARIDFFLEKGSDRVLLNEINTLPGFTEISMYPRLWRAAGIETTELVEELLQLALLRR